MRFIGLLGSLGVALLLVSGAFGLVASTRPGESLQLEQGMRFAGVSSACQGILAEWNINSTQFLSVCSEPSFQTAYAKWGVQDFFTGDSGSTIDPASDTEYYGFEWQSRCQNQSWAGGLCSEQEYWAVNLTSGNISGPVFQEGSPVCSGCPSTPFLAPLYLLIGGSIAAVVIAFVVVTIRRGRRIRGRSPSDSTPMPQAPQK